MTKRCSAAALAAVCLTVPALLLGCEDASAKQRAAVQEQLSTASADLQRVSSGVAWADPETLDKARGKLKAIAQQTSRLDDASEGQQAAGNLLAAAAHRELAAIDMTQIEELERERRELRRLLHSQIDAVVRIDGIRAGQQNTDTRAERSILDDARSQADSLRREYSDRLAQLDGPIADRESANAQDSENAARLEREAGELRRRAAEFGHQDGLSDFEQAIRLERQADQFEFDTAMRETDLRYDLQPEHEYASQRVSFADSLLRDISETEASLDRLDALGSDSVQSARQEITGLREGITSALERLSTGELEAAYDSALEHLDQAVARATAAARSKSEDAKLALARSHEQAGRLRWARARSLAAELDVVKRLVEVGDAIGSAAMYRDRLNDVQQLHQQTIQDANESFNLARQQVSSLRGNAAQRLGTAIDNSLAAMSGQAVNIKVNDDMAPPSMGSASGSSAGGYQTPEQLIAWVNSIDDADLEGQLRVFDVMTADSALSRQAVAGMRNFVDQMARFQAAAEAKIPGGLGPGMEMMGGGGQSSVDNLTLVEKSDTEATVAFEAGMDRGEFQLVNEGNGWMIDGDSMLTAMGLTPESLESLAPMVQVFANLTAQLNAGEITSAEQLQQALMGAMMQMGGG